MRKLLCGLVATLSGIAALGVLASAAWADEGPIYYYPPKFKHRVDPVYTEAARAARETGVVKLKVLIDSSGKAKSFTIFQSSGHKDLDQAVLVAAKASTYQPATKGGKPVTAFYDVSFQFTLRGVEQNEGSEADLAAKLAVNPGDVSTRLTLATIQINKQQYGQAENTLLDGTSRSPNNAKLWARLGVAYFDDAKYKPASDAFDKALALDPRVETAGVAAAAYGRVAFDYESQQQYASAIPYAQKAAQFAPNRIEYKLLLGEAQEGSGDHQAALAQFKTAQSIDDKKSASITARVLADIGGVQLAMGAEAEGNAAIAQAERTDAHNPLPYQTLASYYIKKQNFNAALAPLQQLAAIRPDDVTVQVNIGDIYIRQKNYAAAKVAYDKAVGLDPKNADAQLGLAQLAAADGDVAGADALLQKAIAASPKNAAVYDYLLSNIYLEPPAKGKADHLADAVKYAQAATTADPNYANGWYSLGIAYADQHKKDQANTALRKAYDLFKAQNNADGMKAVNSAYKSINGSDLAGYSSDFGKHEGANRAGGQ